MHTGKTLFAQLMDFLPWTTFSRIVTRYGDDHRVRTLPCAEHFRLMAFAQLTYRENLFVLHQAGAFFVTRTKHRCTSPLLGAERKIPLYSCRILYEIKPGNLVEVLAVIHERRELLRRYIHHTDHISAIACAPVP